MNKNIFLLRLTALCISLALALLILPSCSNKAAPEAAEKDDKGAVTLPAGAMPLSAVLQAVENAGYAPVAEVEFEKDHWQIKGYKGGQLLQLKVDLMNGKILPNPAPAPGKPMSAVIKGLEDQGYGPIVDIEQAEGGDGLEVEAYKGKSEVKIRVEPGSGKITAK
jgi:hypothetical protein